MKKTLRVILLLLLILMILISTVWYLLVYDSDFTRDTILATAREFDKGGHHKAAAWLYDLAYLQSKGGDEVAIELAEHYKSIGNYTKAEYTLSSAISDGGTIDLYIALCKTYIEQDKLLDAVNMLANIKDGEIKSKIDSMRPPMPTFDPAPGFYSQYITVSVSSEDIDLYINTNGEYPSTSAEPLRIEALSEYVKALVPAFFKGEPLPKEDKTDFSNTSVTLPQGETTIYAISIGANNLVSELAIQGYTIGGVIEEINLSDSALDEHIRTLLNFTAGRVIYSNDLWAVTELQLPADVKDYSDLKHFPYLQKLSITDCGNADLTAISTLKDLKYLSVIGAELSQDSLKAIGSLRALEQLTLQSCNLSTVAPLEDLTALTYLDLSKNTLRNINVFSGYTKLQELHMGENALTDLEALTLLADLKIVDVSLNSIQSIKPLLNSAGLVELDISENALETIDGIGALKSLSKLNLSQNLISDASPLAGCTALTEIDISNNKLEDISVVGQLTSLVRLEFSHNEVSELPEFAKDHQLASIDASYNLLKSLTPLSSLSALYFVDVDHNAEISTLDPLINNIHITKVNCFGTKVAVNPFPEEQGVVVNLDPSNIFKPEG